MREIYPLTTETLKVLTGHVSSIAEEMHKTPQYIHGILSGKEQDRFAQFVPVYAAAKRAGAPVCHWRNKLDAIDARYDAKSPVKQAVECLLEKIHTDSETTANLVEALKDGELDERECQKLLADIEKNRANDDLLEEYAKFRLGVIEDEKANKGKRNFQVARSNGNGRNK
jgi:hypothetical protein